MRGSTELGAIVVISFPCASYHVVVGCEIDREIWRDFAREGCAAQHLASGHQITGKHRAMSNHGRIISSWPSLSIRSIDRCCASSCAVRSILASANVGHAVPRTACSLLLFTLLASNQALPIRGGRQGRKPGSIKLISKSSREHFHTRHTLRPSFFALLNSHC